MNRIILSLLPLLLTGLASCNRWLDIRPETEVDRDVLFSTAEGYEEALLGIYSRGTVDDLYGKELTIGTPEVLAQHYTISNQDPLGYLQTSRYAYNDDDFIARKDRIWSGLYHAIANCNLILGQIDGDAALFAPGVYELIKGEALALRAYFHFDALRLFAPAPASNAGADAIPYVTAYSKNTTPLSTVDAVLDSIVRDLQAAKTLLEADPIRSPAYVVGYPVEPTRNTEEQSQDLFLQNRRHRMNYFAVCGTLARAYLYKGDKSGALAEAQTVIQANKFPWTAMEDFVAVDAKDKDRIRYKELVFGWYIPGKRQTYNDNWFRENTSGMYIDQSVNQAFYETATVGSNDQRYRQWYMSTSQNNMPLSIITKYRRNSLSDADDANRHYMMAPAIRLSELYYIAAECTYPGDPAAAAAYLDAVRIQRGIGEPVNAPSEAAFIEELLKEYRKELLAEGQVFYAYKRLNRAIPAQNGTAIAPSDAVFVLPLPDDEIIYGNR